MEISKLEVKKTDIEKISFLNIDSRYRNKEPRNILENSQLFLDSNCISVIKNSDVVKIEYKSHNLSVFGTLKINSWEKSLIYFTTSKLKITYTISKYCSVIINTVTITIQSIVTKIITSTICTKCVPR